MSANTQPPTAPPVPQDIAALAAMLLELDDMLVSCMRCGFCQAVCPVYGATMREADVTRGKIALLENLAHHIITDAESVNEKLNRCLLCGSCQANCPSGVKIMDIFLRARSIVMGYLGLSPIKKMIFRGFLVRPKLFDGLLGLSKTFQGLFIRDDHNAAGTYQAPLFSAFIGDRHFPALAKEPFHTTTSALAEKAGPGRPVAALFPGCVSDKIFPQLAQATVKILRKHQTGIFLPAGQNCCGIPALASGDRKTFDQLVRQNLAIFKTGTFDYLVTPCATCAATIKEIWPKFSNDYTPEEQATLKEMSEKAIDITAFIVDVLKAELPESAQGGRRVTYHDSCHLKKSLNVSSQPRRILKNIPGLEFVEMPEADRCCGSGGSFTLAHYDLSKKIGQRKRDNIVSVKPDLVAAACPACMMQIMDMLSRNGDNIPVKHVAELYADSLG
ncbi:MAG: (Fe-S)-binding protein [Candidatus Adiutrix sp.]|jgi:glycolate oxidase iron-sulfur subunit|nr:(Fe-S)-binding protein [Candidatus Adiutrix sp.]